MQIIGFIPLFIYYLFLPALEKIARNTSTKGLAALVLLIFFFLLAKRCNAFLEKNLAICEKLRLFSSFSFGVFLIHGIVLSLLPFEHSSRAFRLGGIHVVYFSCYLFSYLLKKLDFCSWMLL